MNDVTDICHRILARPAPPMRDGADVLATARRASRRQVHLMVAATGLVAAAVVAVTAFAGVLHAAPRTPRPDVLLTAVAIPGLSQPPAREKAVVDGARVAQLVAEALSTGSTGRLVVPDGALFATSVRDGVAAPPGDLCAPAVAARLDAHLPGGDAGCQMITIDGVPVRATTTAEGVRVTRFLASGFLTLDWHPTHRGPASPVTVQRLAEWTGQLRIPA